MRVILEHFKSRVLMHRQVIFRLWHTRDGQLFRRFARWEGSSIAPHNSGARVCCANANRGMIGRHDQSQTRVRVATRAGRGHALDGMLFRVLLAIDETGSLAEAARRLGVSYRHAWGLMGKWEKVFGRPLARLRQGHGTELSEFGRKLLWAEQLVQARSHARTGRRAARNRARPRLRRGRPAPESVRESRPRAGRVARPARPARWPQARPAFQGQPGKSRRPGQQPVQPRRFSYRRRHGALREGRIRALPCAGHAHADRRGDPHAGPHARARKPEEHPQPCRPDRKNVRIVNRQRGSGSRVEFDQLLSGAGIDRPQ